MSTIVIAVGLVCGGMGVYLTAMVAVLNRREKCPSCGAKKVVLVRLTRGSEWPPVDRPSDTSVHVCRACGIEACREGAGPLIPKLAWDAGERAPRPLPTATLVKR